MRQLSFFVDGESSSEGRGRLDAESERLLRAFGEGRLHEGASRRSVLRETSQLRSIARECGSPGRPLPLAAAFGDVALVGRALREPRAPISRSTGRTRLRATQRFLRIVGPRIGRDAASDLAALDALLPADGVPTRLVIVGGASGNGNGVSDPHSLRRMAADLGVADRVAFLAPRPHPELAPLYRAADVVVVPSHSESFGLVALEAQACGTPVVASDIGGLRAAVNGGGRLVRSRDPRDFAAALLPYLVDARVRAKAADAARRHAARFSWTATAQGTLEVYRMVLRQRRLALDASGLGASGVGAAVPDAEAQGA